MSGLEKLGNFNIKIVWVIVLISLLIPSFITFSLPVTVSSMTTDYYNLLNNLPENSTVYICNAHQLMSYYPLKGAMVLTLQMLMEHHAKFVMQAAITSESSVVYDDWLTAANPQKYGYVYGRDYVIFSYLSGGEIALASMAQDPWKAYQTDYYGTPLADLPLMQHIHSWKDFNVAIGSASDCTVQDMFVRQWCVGKQNPIDDPYSKNGLLTLFVPQSTCAPNTVPYVKANPGFHAILYGTQGAAEFEAVANRLGQETSLANAKNLGVIVFTGLILCGNIAYFSSKYGKKEVKK